MKLKLTNGPSFGVNVSEKQGLAKLLRRSNKYTHVIGSKIVTSRLRSQPVNITLLQSASESNRIILEKAPRIIRSSEVDFLWVQLMKGFMNPYNVNNHERVNHTITNLWEVTPANALFIIYTGRRSRKRLNELEQRNIMARVRKGPPMTESEKVELGQLKCAMKSHYVWIAVKNS